MPAQLNINEYYVDNIIVQSNDHFKRTEIGTCGIHVDFDIKRNKDNPLDFLISMLIELNKKDEDFELAEYRILLNITGIYSFAEGTDDATINNMIAPSGLSILYGVARGVLSQITGNCRHGKFILPTLNFMEIIKNKFKKLAESETATPLVEEPPPTKKKKIA